MAKRKEPFLTTGIYHIYNRGVEKRSIFSDNHDYKRFVKTITFYLYHHPAPRFSEYLRLSSLAQQVVDTRRTSRGTKVATCICYVCMPNHFHLLAEQSSDTGLTQFLQDISNSYTRFFNTRHHRVGHLFQGPFKAARIETDEQLLHVSRYIHLNPLSSGIVTTFEDVLSYPWSSIHQYLLVKNGFCDTKKILDHFRSKDNSYRTFLADNADYQRHLEHIKHISHE